MFSTVGVKINCMHWFRIAGMGWIRFTDSIRIFWYQGRTLELKRSWLRLPHIGVPTWDFDIVRAWGDASRTNCWPTNSAPMAPVSTWEGRLEYFYFVNAARRSQRRLKDADAVEVGGYTIKCSFTSLITLTSHPGATPLFAVTYRRDAWVYRKP